MKKEFILILVIFIGITSAFFYPVFKGDMPFPGDLLVGNTNPYNSLSFDGYAPGGVPNKAQGTDVIRELYPWKHFVIEMIKKGQVAFWNPYDFSGNPLMANFQSGNFYPLNLIFLELSFNDAWTLFIFLIPFLSAIFTYLYLREIKISKLAAALGAISFAFSSYIVVWMEYGNIGHTFLWLPLGLYLTEKVINNFKAKYLIFLIVVLSLAFLAGYIQGYFYITLACLYYYLFKSFLNKQILTKKTIIFFLAIFFPLLLGAFQLLPTLELFKFSSRGNYSLAAIEKLLNPWWYAITTIAPDFFGNPANRNHWFDGTYIERVSYFGVIPFVLALIALSRFKKRQEIAIFGLMFIASFIFAYNILFIKFFYLLPIPIISTTVPTRVLSIFVFSGAILAGIGLEILLKEGKQKHVYLACGFVSLVLAIAWIYAISNKQTIGERNLVTPSLFALLFIVFSWFYFINKRLKTIFIISVFAITLFDLFRFFHKITPFAPQKYAYPATRIISYLQKNTGINRYWGYGSGHIETNIQLYDHTFLPDGHDALHIKTYAEFLSTTRDRVIPSELSRSDSEITPGYGSEDLKNNYYRQKTLNLLGVKYLLLKDADVVDNKAYKLIWQDAPWKIYENLQTAPRAFLTTDYKVVANKKDIIHMFYDKAFNESKTIILEEEPNLKPQTIKVKKVKVLTYEPNKILLDTSSDADALLFLSDTYYPGWKATVDGKETKIHIADYTFRAVKVAKGEHKVEFYYEPESFKNGLILSGIALISLIGFYSLIVRDRKI